MAMYCNKKCSVVQVCVCGSLGGPSPLSADETHNQSASLYSILHCDIIAPQNALTLRNDNEGICREKAREGASSQPSHDEYPVHTKQTPGINMEA